MLPGASWPESLRCFDEWEDETVRDELGTSADTVIEHAAFASAAGLGRARVTQGEPDCLNCGAALAGDYCHMCGQSAQGLRRPFLSLLGESLETLFSLDGRTARSLPALLISRAGSRAPISMVSVRATSRHFGCMSSHP